MCDYCDCRLVPAIAELNEEHELLLGVTARLRDALDEDDGARIASTVAELTDALTTHTEREERGVFAALREVGAGDHVARYADEHVELDALLADASALRRFVTGLEAHIAREETDLFPAARQLLGPSDWDAVDRVHRHVHPPTLGAPA